MTTLHTDGLFPRKFAERVPLGKLTNKNAETHPDAWQRFEHAVDVVAKSPPQHRVKERPAKKSKRRASSSKPKNA
jgi:hypothetical protein